MSIYSTNYSRFISKLLQSFFPYFSGSWRNRSISLLSLLIGFYIASSFLASLLSDTTGRIFIVFLIVLIIEFLIRIRTLVSNSSSSTFFISLDNLRIGITYAVVLEAFKLGS